jgi:hypothetical protein
VPKHEVYEFEVLPENWKYYRIYDGCQATYIENVCLGISAQEIEAKCKLEGITGAKLRNISRGVSEMSKAMVQYLDEKRKK